MPDPRNRWAVRTQRALTWHTMASYESDRGESMSAESSAATSQGLFYPDISAYQPPDINLSGVYAVCIKVTEGTWLGQSVLFPAGHAGQGCRCLPVCLSLSA